MFRTHFWGTWDTLCFTSVCHCSSERAPAEHARMFRTHFWEIGDTLCFSSVCLCISERAPAEHPRMFCTLFGELGTRFVSRASATAHRSVLPRNMYSCSAPISGKLKHALFHEHSRISKHCFSIQIPKQVRNDKFKIIFPHRYFKTSFHKQSRAQNGQTPLNCPPGTEGAPHAHRRTLAPTKPNLELETVCKRARPCYNLLDSITIRYKFFYLIKK